MGLFKRTTFIAVVIFLALSASYAHAQQELKALFCESNGTVMGWVNGAPTMEPLKYMALVKEDSIFVKAEVSGAYQTEQRSLRGKDIIYDRIVRNRFSYLESEETGCRFNLILPKNFSSRGAEFFGVVEYACPLSTRNDYVDMTCHL